MADIWILVETRDGEATRATRELITLAQSLGGIPVGDAARQPVHLLGIEAQDLGHLANGAARTVGDHQS